MPTKESVFIHMCSILPATRTLTRSPLPEDKPPPQEPLQNSTLKPVPLYCLLTSNLSTHLRHQIRHRLMSRSPPPERVALRECILISYALAQTEKELRGAEMLLLLAKLIHLHATLSPWQFHNKSRETPIEAGQPCPRLSA